ncbi:hypothetical protein [Actinomadura barringtoniae]|uniref:hypothetical protein n=1 Tax=Actinomadura barringtoniae TaxID=1427535 RepID=UPI001FB7E6C8|nr:hypothetical protein [Actinomadura barringtoniae]
MSEIAEAKWARAGLETLALQLDGTPAAASTFKRKRAVFKHALGQAVEDGDFDANPLDRVKWRPSKQNDSVDRRVVVNPSQGRELLTAVSYVGRTRGPRLRAMFACMYFAGLRPGEGLRSFGNWLGADHSQEVAHKDYSGSAYAQVWKQARALALTPVQVESPLAGRPYDLRHAAVSLWLNAGVHAPEAAERAGHSVDVMLRVYAKCIDGQQDVANERIELALAA